MNVYYSDDPMSKLCLRDRDLIKKPSLFLAGPTPRSSNVKGWRPDALKILEDKDVTNEEPFNDLYCLLHKAVSEVVNEKKA